MRCEKCGKELPAGATFCGKCGERVKSSAPFRSEPYSGGRRISTGVNRMPQGIALGVDEQVVKKYNIGRYTFRQGSIDVIVTNKRVIRYEESNWFGMQNNHIDEINIDAVHGMTTNMVRSISILGLIASLCFIGGGLSILLNRYLSRYGYGYFGIIGIVIGVIIILNSFRPTLQFAIHGSVGGQALVTTVNMRGRIFGRNDTSVIFQFKPTPETTVMLKEIGACVYDLKTLGDAAIPKWC